jgi:hypothetical protein
MLSTTGDTPATSRKPPDYNKQTAYKSQPEPRGTYTSHEYQLFTDSFINSALYPTLPSPPGLTQPLSLKTTVSALVPLTIIKGAGHEHIALPAGENALAADFYTTRTKTTTSPTHITSGFYNIVPGKERPASYTYEEMKYVLEGQIDVLVCPPMVQLGEISSGAALTMSRMRRRVTRTISSPVTLRSSMLGRRSRYATLPSFSLFGSVSGR